MGENLIQNHSWCLWLFVIIRDYSRHKFAEIPAVQRWRSGTHREAPSSGGPGRRRCRPGGACPAGAAVALAQSCGWPPPLASRRPGGPAGGPSPTLARGRTQPRWYGGDPHGVPGGWHKEWHIVSDGQKQTVSRPFCSRRQEKNECQQFTTATSSEARWASCFSNSAGACATQ